MVVAPTNSKVFWDSTGPGGKFDGVHEISAWQFMSNRACKYYLLGTLAFIWDVPTDLEPLPTYRLRFTINSNVDEEHISEPFHIRFNGSESSSEHFSSETVPLSWIIYPFALVGVAFVGLLAVRVLLGRRQRDGSIRLKGNDSEI
jgi:hypothetical protein